MAISAEAAKQLRDVIDETLKNPEVVVEEPAGGGVPEAKPVLRGIAGAIAESW